MVGNLNNHLVQEAYETLLVIQELTDQVTLPTHVRGGTLDPVISELQEDTLQYHQLGLVGSSDHHALLTQVYMGVARDKASFRTVCFWDKADWFSIGTYLRDRVDHCTSRMGGVRVANSDFPPLCPPE